MSSTLNPDNAAGTAKKEHRRTRVVGRESQTCCALSGGFLIFSDVPCCLDALNNKRAIMARRVGADTSIILLFFGCRRSLTEKSHSILLTSIKYVFLFCVASVQCVLFFWFLKIIGLARSPQGYLKCLSYLWFYTVLPLPSPKLYMCSINSMLVGKCHTNASALLLNWRLD